MIATTLMIDHTIEGSRQKAFDQAASWQTSKAGGQKSQPLFVSRPQAKAFGVKEEQCQKAYALNVTAEKGTATAVSSRVRLRPNIAIRFRRRVF